MLRKSKAKLLVITLTFILCLTLIPRATASYGAVRSFLRNPISGSSPANENAAFNDLEYYNRIISLWTTTPLCFPWGDAIFDGDVALGMGHSYYWLKEEIASFVEFKKWTKNDWRVVFYIDGIEVDTTMTPLVYQPTFDENGDGIRDPAYVLRVGASFKPGELPEGEHTWNFKEFEYNHNTNTWETVFDWSWYFTSFFWIEYS